MSYRKIGTGAGDSADGAHNHAGTYASTAHAATHDGVGSDPIAALGSHTVDGAISFTNNTPAPTSETNAYLSGLLQGYYPWVVHNVMNDVAELMDGDAFFGPLKWSAWPGASVMTTAFGPAGAAVGTGTYALQAMSSTLPRRGRHSTPATATTRAGFESSDQVWIGAGIGGGWVYQTLINLSDASYANSGASTGSRIFCGMSDQTAINSVNADNPAGNRFGFSYCNVNGGLTNTNWFLTEKNNTTENRTDTGMTLAQNKLYRMTLHQPRGWPYLGWQIENLTDATTQGNIYSVNATGPLGTALLRAVVALQTVNAVARSIEIVRLSAKVTGP